MSTLKTNNIQHVDRSDPSIVINTDGSVNIAGTMTYEDVTNVDAVGIITGRSNIDAQKQVHVGTGVSVKAGGINVTAGITTVQALQATTGSFSGNLSITNKIIHAGDVDTAIRFPDADTISAETAGTERLRIESGGNIGINTDNPNNLLHVYGGQIKAQTSTDDTNTNVDLIRAQSGSGGSALFAIRAANAADDNSNWDIKTNANEDLTFTIGAGSEKLRITSDGRVLIGGHTTASIVAPGGVEALTTAAYSIGGARFVASASGPCLALAKSRNGTVGSHTIVQDGDTLGVIKFRGSDGGEWVDAATIKSSVDGTPGDDDMPGRLVFATTADGASDSTERMRIDSSGRVIITNDSVTNPTGTNTQYAPLVVRGNTSATSSRSGWLTLARSEASANISANEGIGEIYFGDQQAGEYGAIKCFADAAAAVGDYPGRLSFWTTADGGTTMSERLRIDSSGQALFSGLTVNNDTRNANGISIKSSSGISFQNYGSNGSRNWRIRPDDMHGWGALDFSASPTANDNNDWPDHADDIVLSLEGGTKDAVVKNGNLKIGTAGKGIDFSATADGTGSSQAEILDDYEEGSWTPVWSDASSGGTAATTNQPHGRYTKTGRVVHLHFYTWSIQNQGTSNAIYLQGLPFASIGGFSFIGSVGGRYFNQGDDNQYNLQVRVNANNSYGNLEWAESHSGDGVAATFAGIVNAYTNFTCTLTYLTDS